MATMTTEIIPLDITSGFSPAKFKQLDNRQLYNLFVTSQGALYPTAGHERIGDFSYGTIARGMFKSDLINENIVIFDTNVFRVNKNGGHIFLNPNAPLGTANLEVFIAENGINEIAFSDFSAVYIFNTDTSAFTKIELPDGVTPGMIDYKDGRFILNDRERDRWYISNEGTGTIWDPLAWTIINSQTVGIAAFEQQVIVFGETLTEIYYDAGVIPFPFQRSNTIAFEYGCLTATSISKGYGFIFWLGVNKNSAPEIMVSDSRKPRVVTQGDISFFINQLKFLEDCESFVYQVNSEIFYQINWNKDNVSLLYNLNANKFSIVTDYKRDINPIKFITRFNNTQYALSRTDGFLYKFDIDVYSDNGRAVPRWVIPQNLIDRDKKFDVRKMQLYLEQGIAKVPQTTCAPECEPCVDAQCFLHISHDRGVTFPITKQLQLAPLGARTQLLHFFNLGSDRFWTFKIEFISPDRISLFGVDVEVVR